MDRVVMMHHWVTAVVIRLGAVLALSGACWCAMPVASPEAPQYAYTLPAGTRISALLQEEISTRQAVVGQPLRAVVANEMFMGKTKILTRFTRLYGHVLVSQPPTQGRNAILKIGFNQLVLENGLDMPVVADVQTGSERHEWGGELTEGTQPEVVPYNIYRIGTYGRVVYRGPRAMGEHVTLPTGTWLVLILQEPLTIYAF